MTFKEYIVESNIKNDTIFLDCSNNCLIDLIGIENFINKYEIDFSDIKTISDINI